MNYQRQYNLLIQRAKNRVITGYSETHHILPRCMGGDDDSSNLVRLSAREHFIAHLLLVKIHKGNLSLVKAVAMMCVGEKRRITNRLYGKTRELFRIAQSEAQSGENNSQFGKKWIYNPLTKEEKKINTSEVPEGWKLGRYSNSELKKQYKKEQIAKVTSFKLQEQKKLYTDYYQVYNQVGFDEFVRITNYKYSKPNLVSRFAKYVDEFVPQNGKKRAKKIE